MEIGTYVRPASLDEAYSLIAEKRAFPLGGGAWAHMNARKAEIAVDLEGLGLRYIREEGGNIEIGAMTTARDCETSPLLRETFGGLFREATCHLVGVQLRNIITIGGTVAGKYGFSDVITTLLALDASLVFHRDGEAKLADFLLAPRETPFLLEKIVVGKGRKAAFGSVRITRNDFAILNACASFDGASWKIAVGARPAAARLAPRAAAFLGAERSPSPELAGRAAALAAEEMVFGDDHRGSGEYRRSICAVLVRRAIMEVGA